MDLAAIAAGQLMIAAVYPLVYTTWYDKHLCLWLTLVHNLINWWQIYKRVYIDLLKGLYFSSHTMITGVGIAKTIISPNIIIHKALNRVDD